jgi:hypothetical protein
MAKETQRAGDYPVTPDGRYFVVNGRLWRMSNPLLPLDERDCLVSALMKARRQVAAAQRIGDKATEDIAHESVDRTKRALGERGPVWWEDGAQDYNRRAVTKSPYAEWFVGLNESDCS